MSKASPQLPSSDTDVLRGQPHSNLSRAVGGLGFYTLNPATNQIHAEPHCLELFGLSETHPVWHLDDILAMMPEKERIAYNSALDALRTGKQERFELCLSVHRNGDETEVLSVLDRARLVFEQGLPMIAGARIDISGLLSRVNQSEQSGNHRDPTWLLNQRGISQGAEQNHLNGEEQPLAGGGSAPYQAPMPNGHSQVYTAPKATDSHNVSMAILVQDAVRMARVLPVFQPLVGLVNRAPMGEEAFARIYEHSRRLLNAGAFVEVARQLQLLHRIDQMLFSATYARITHPPATSSRRASAHPLPIFVNISGDLLKHPDTLSEMARAIESEPLSRREAIVLVLNERDIAERYAEAAKALAPMVDLGCGLSIAGYGSSERSLGFLDVLPVSFLAFDSSLIEEAQDSEKARSIIQDIQSRARDAGITTIAKQIQSYETLTLAQSLGVDWGQGYLLGVPSDPKWPVSATSHTFTPS
ncbi:EAL domain-containing protein [Thiorhodovibrio litoralis]|uniref:EAL domain-containing protein n=1 Tax=Thiorhodovibrio litoralis TaxID=2952932 RepID=UPI002B26116F|nr:EAL domain-containing protein [Thiorhodovibrio litoralis]WPL11509.1 Bacteriophytochrome cph2 [Thiorhodovibrio litoralis]